MDACIIFDAYSSFTIQYLNKFGDFRIDVKRKIADIAVSLLDKSIQEVRDLREDIVAKIEKCSEKYDVDVNYVENIPHIKESTFTYAEKLEAIMLTATYRFYYEVFEAMNSV